VRDTGREPSKSGIVGLLCAALGRPRTDTHTTRVLGGLIMGVRVDREGQILRDFHTAGQGAADPYKGYLQADGKSPGKGTIISNRYYLTDAMFLVGLTGDEALLETLQGALANPCWMLSLGRKACPPARPVYLPDGLWPQALDDSLRAYPWLGSSRAEHQRLVAARQRLRMVIEDEKGPEMRKDSPLSFERDNRRFTYRRYRQELLDEVPLFRPLFARPREATP
jgi:CRISPR system Cascade subunit CasD